MRMGKNLAINQHALGQRATNKTVSPNITFYTFLIVFTPNETKLIFLLSRSPNCIRYSKSCLLLCRTYLFLD